MANPKDRGALPKLLSEAILQLCRVGVGLHGSFNIDGIICIENMDTDSRDVVVKIHEKICGGVLQTSNSTNQTVNHFVNQSSATAPRVSNVFNTANSNQTFANACQNEITNPQVSYNCPQPMSDFTQKRDDFPNLIDSDCEILDETTHKQLFGELGNICDSDLGGLYDVDFGDLAIKPDPARNKNSSSPLAQVASTSNNIEEISDDELKIEKLTAGRVRKPHKARNSYKDVHGASVQVLSFEEYSRTLKSEKLKRGRDRSPDFISSKRVYRSTPEQYRSNQQFTGASTSYSLADVAQVASVHDANIASIRSLSSVTNTTSSHPRAAVGVHLASKAVSAASVRNGAVMEPNFGNRYTQRKVNSGKQFASKQIESAAKQMPTETERTAQSPILSSQEVTKPPGKRNNSVQITYQTGKQLQNINEKNATDSGSSNTQLAKNTKETTLGVLENVGAAETVETSTQNSVPKSIVCVEDFNQSENSNPHKCPCCAAVYDTFKQLDVHMQNEHRGKFMCPVCGKLFKQKNTRNRHIVAIHSQQKNFQCNLCAVSFTRIDSIKKHYKSAHPHLEVPKCPYSYSRGEASAVGESEVVYVQDIDGSDIKYIEENLMSVAAAARGDLVQDVIIQDVIPTNLIIENAATIANITPTVTEQPASTQVVALKQNNSSLVVDGQNVTMERVSSNVILKTMQSSSEDSNAPQVIEISSNHSESTTSDTDKVSTTYVNIIKSASTNSLVSQVNNSKENCDQETNKTIGDPDNDQVDEYPGNTEAEKINSPVTLVVETQTSSDSDKTKSPTAEVENCVAVENTENVAEDENRTEVQCSEKDAENSTVTAEQTRQTSETDQPDSVAATKTSNENITHKTVDKPMVEKSVAKVVTSLTQQIIGQSPAIGSNKAPVIQVVAPSTAPQLAVPRVYTLAQVIQNAVLGIAIPKSGSSYPKTVGDVSEDQAANKNGTESEAAVDKENADYDEQADSTIEISDEEMETTE